MATSGGRACAKLLLSCNLEHYSPGLGSGWSCPAAVGAAGPPLCLCALLVALHLLRLRRRRLRRAGVGACRSARRRSRAPPSGAAWPRRTGPTAAGCRRSAQHTRVEARRLVGPAPGQRRSGEVVRHDRGDRDPLGHRLHHSGAGGRGDAPRDGDRRRLRQDRHLWARGPRDRRRRQRRQRLLLKSRRGPRRRRLR